MIKHVTLESKDIVVEEAINDRTGGTSEEQDVIDNIKEVTKSPEQVAQQILVDKVLQGDKDAFGAIVDQYNALMMRTALMIIGDRDIAADAVQDALIAL